MEKTKLNLYLDTKEVERIKAAAVKQGIKYTTLIRLVLSKSNLQVIK